MIRLTDNDKPYWGIRAAVLGASGFIGRWVARGLWKRGAKVYLIVRSATAMRKIAAEYDIEGDILEQDLSDFEGTYKLFNKIHPSIVFNLAGYGVNREERDPETTFKINAELVMGISEAVAASRDPRWPGQDIVQVGSALEYGKIAGSLQEDSIPEPTTVYGQSKLAATRILSRCSRAFGLKGLTARLFTVYGPGELDGRLLPSLIRTASGPKPLELTAGEQKRDFTFVEDAAEGLLRLGLASGVPGDVVNLATGRLTSVREFARVASTILHIPEERLVFGAIATRPEEMDHSPVGLERLRGLTGWVPTTDIETGICKTLEFERRRDQTHDPIFPIQPQSLCCAES